MNCCKTENSVISLNKQLYDEKTYKERRGGNEDTLESP